METLKSLNPLQEKSSTQNIVDSVRSLNPLQEKSNTEKVLEKFSFTPSNDNIEFNMNSNSGGSWMTRIFLLIIIVILMIITFGAYLVKGKTEGSKTLRTVFSKGGGALMDTMEQTFNKFVEGTRFSGGVLAGSVKSMLNLIKTMFVSLDYQDKIYVKQKEKKKKEGKSKMEKEVMEKGEDGGNASPDSVESTIQEKKKPGFCYVGYQAPHNACIQLDDVKKCMSGKAFDTMDECVNYKPQK
jgi:hypothetical protein